MPGVDDPAVQLLGRCNVAFARVEKRVCVAAVDLPDVAARDLDVVPAWAGATGVGVHWAVREVESTLRVTVPAG